ncbi:hemolysin E [Escherichia coli]|nr:hemolysin E [Escherichia coli]EIF7315189.1 hemolysin E [Escherichia coli]EIJ5920135.1 hemolysin E [Escherichia coli]EIO7901094.1 hemolysin E [Escherichia coli]EIZ3516621.1 hemolysin E [Escherichia coli]
MSRQVIPWQTFDETIKELSRFKQEYSQAASVLVGDIKTLLMDSQDKYFEATQTVYEWCGVVWCCDAIARCVYFAI